MMEATHCGLKLTLQTGVSQSEAHNPKLACRKV